MTLEEAKKILEEEGFYVEKATRPCVLNGWFTKYESPEICEAVQVVCSAGYKVLMFETAFQARKERLKKEYEKNTKDPAPGEEQPKEDNPALAESASQFNDALLDEQAKEIESLRDKCKKYADILDSVGDKLRELKEENRRIKNSDLNLEGLIYATRELEEKNKKIEELTKEKSNLEDQITILNACKKHNDKIDRKQIKSLGKEIAKLNGIIHDKNAILSDVAEELRLTKIREKNLAELGLKYVGENEKLKKELADKVVDKIDAQALKSAESALACKEQLIYYKDKIIAYNKKKIAEKNKEIRALKLQISALEKRGNGIDWKRNADAIKLYVNRASRERLWNPINQDICNEQELSFIINHGGKRVKYALRFDGTDIVYECSDPDKKPRIPTPELSEEELMKLQEKVCVDIAEEGKDLSGVIVLCGKDFIDAIKKMK